MIVRIHLVRVHVNRMRTHINHLHKFYGFKDANFLKKVMHQQIHCSTISLQMHKLESDLVKKLKLIINQRRHLNFCQNQRVHSFQINCQKFRKNHRWIQAKVKMIMRLSYANQNKEHWKCQGWVDKKGDYNSSHVEEKGPLIMRWQAANNKVV